MFIIISKKNTTSLFPFFPKYSNIHQGHTTTNHQGSHLEPYNSVVYRKTLTVSRPQLWSRFFPMISTIEQTAALWAGVSRGQYCWRKATSGLLHFTSGHEMKHFVSQKISQLFSFAEVKRMQKWNFHRKKIQWLSWVSGAKSKHLVASVSSTNSRCDKRTTCILCCYWHTHRVQSDCGDLQIP